VHAFLTCLRFERTACFLGGREAGKGYTCIGMPSERVKEGIEGGVDGWGEPGISGDLSREGMRQEAGKEIRLGD